MNREDAKTFVRAMSGANVYIEDHVGWINVSCPLAPWTHEKGTDRSPSFGISINTLDSKYHCFTCKSKGTLSTLVARLTRLSNKDHPLLEEYVESEEFGGLIPEWDEENEVDAVATQINDDMVYMYDLVGHHDYLESRGIDETTSIDIGLRIDPEAESNDGRERILFPVHTKEGGVVHFAGFTGRATDDEKTLKVRDYYGLPKRKVLLGIEHIRDQDEYVVLSEGLFDFALGFKYGAPALACMHSTLTPDQARILINLNKSVYLMMDNDNAGRDGSIEIMEMLQDYLPVYKTSYPDRFEFGDGDPATLSEDEYWEMINTARLL
ncbi:MAG: hypothetical protein DRQ40_07705 [Gammaproteobacteria bacterium]|nr:MAG: hypothetical protein DRQ40_07705 [Gammaproteobacteria bacterium]